MDFVNELRKRGKRITNAREVVCKILETSGHKHFTVEELHKLSLKKDKNIQAILITDLRNRAETIKKLKKNNWKLLKKFENSKYGSTVYLLVL